MANGEETRDAPVEFRIPETLTDEIKPLIKQSGYLSPDFTRACMARAEAILADDVSLIDELIEDWNRLNPTSEEPDRRVFRTTPSDKAYWVWLCGDTRLKCNLSSYIFASLLLFKDYFGRNGHLIPSVLQKLKNRQMARCMAPKKKLKQTCMEGMLVPIRKGKK